MEIDTLTSTSRVVTRSHPELNTGIPCSDLSIRTTAHHARGRAGAGRIRVFSTPRLDRWKGFIHQ